MERILIEDALHPQRTLDGNDIDAWDPDYIRRILPIYPGGDYETFRPSWPR